MQATGLRQLDKRTIAVELTLPDRKQTLKGVGRFDSRDNLGPSLHVGIKDPKGDFEIVLKESDWHGRIDPGGESGCEFTVHLDASCLCAH